MRRLLLLVGMAALVHPCSTRGDDAPASVVVAVDPAILEGRPQQDLVKVDNARYYVWHDSQGWHVRTAAKGFVKFTGSISLQNGAFGKLRTIGLDVKAKNPDRWNVNGDRTQLRYELHTGGSFDGFDFDVRRAGEAATLTFDLKQGPNDLPRPARIFLGRDSKSPPSAHFKAPASPDLTTPQAGSPASSAAGVAADRSVARLRRE